MSLTFTAIEGRNPQIQIDGDLVDFVPLVVELEAWALDQEHEAYDVFTDPTVPIRIWEESAPTLVFNWIDILTKSAILAVHDPKDPDKKAVVGELIHKVGPGERLRRLVDEESEPESRRVRLNARPIVDVSEVGAVAGALISRGTESPDALTLLAGLDKAWAQIAPIEFSDTEWGLINRATKISHCGDYGHLWWNPDAGAVVWVGGDADGPEQGYTDITEIEKQLGSVDGVASVEVYDEHDPNEVGEDDSPWIRLPTSPPAARPPL